MSTAESIQPFISLQSQFDKLPQSRRSSSSDDSGKVDVESPWLEDMIDGRVHIDSEALEEED